MTWLNDKLASLETEIKAIENKQIFFVGGIPKSGTTWLECIIDAHPEAICKGEAHFGSLLEPVVRQTLATYNAQIPKKGNWARNKEENSGDSQANAYTFDNNDLDCLLGEAIKLMLVKWAKSDDIKCIGDKSPQNLAYYPLFQRIFPQAKYIYVVRDVRDVIVSGWFFNLAIDAASAIERYKNIQQYAVIVAKLWTEDISKAKAYGRILNERYIEVQYEKLWRTPEPEVDRLFEFIEVAHTRSIIEGCLRLADFSVLSKGRKRGTENRSSFYRKGVIGDWRNHLDAETLDKINSLCGPVLNDLGYA